MRNSILILFVFVFFLGCKALENENKKSEKPSSDILQVNEQFQEFIDQFPEIKLPLRLSGCDYHFLPLKKLNEEISSPYEKKPYYIFGKIKTNGSYIATIVLELNRDVECFLPILTTYKLNGERIDSKSIAIGECYRGACDKCEDQIEIDMSLNLYTADNHFDLCGDPFDEPDKETIYKTGKITVNGIIELTNKQKK